MVTFPHALRLVLRFIGVIGSVAAVTYVNYDLLHLNSPTAAFSYLLLVLALATRAGLNESIVASLAGMLAYNFFFLPPIGTLTIADPQNWVALVVFLVTAITASHLSSSARRKAEEAASREQEVRRMYDFSRALMLRDPSQGLADQTTQKIAELFRVEDVSLYDRESGLVYRTVSSVSASEESILREVARTGEPWRNADAAALVVPIRLGGPSLGSLAIAGSRNVSEVALQAIAQLVAIALERARAQEVAARAKAARESEQLKSTLLDALAHEFKTPLTSIKAAATTVLSRNKLDEMDQDLLTVVDEESDHLNDLVTEAIELARIGSGPVKLHRELCSVEELVSSAMTHLRSLSEGRVLDVRIERKLPRIDVDRRLAELALRQLLNNALKYSPPSSQIQIAAESHNDGVVIRVSNAGPGIPSAEQSMIFEKFYRGVDARNRIAGTGMGLTIAREIVEAHGGRIWLNSEPDQGVQFSFTLPVIRSRKIPSNRQPQVA